MERTDFYNAIENFRNENRETYKDSPKRFISDYNRETESTKEYNGRQILELIQNADDAESDTVQIILEKTENKLVISNKGVPFSVQGIESLMMSNLSTKIKKIFIGNKGLGFRSILNWSNKILIRTNGCCVEFSPSIAAEEFKKLPIGENVKESILKERGLTENAIPFPVLSIPRITFDEITENKWTTIIEIYYKSEFEKDIQSQLQECREEILLFLNNIENIDIVGLQSGNIKINRVKITENDLTYIQIHDKIWRIESSEAYLPDELQDHNKIDKESYNITIAFQEDLSNSYYKLFNYFPTKLSIYLPCIVHGTFELNSSRDYLNDSPKNDFIFKKIIELFRITSCKLVEESEYHSDWRPIMLLLPLKFETDSKQIEEFYINLKKLSVELKVLPCVDGKYEYFNNVKYYGKSFSEWVIQRKYMTNFPGLLIPEVKIITDSLKLESKNYPQPEFSLIINQLSAEIKDLNVRAELLTLMLDDYFKQNKNEKYSILVNDKNEIIDKSNVAFTPTIETEGIFQRPTFVQIDFINRNLYDILISMHKERFEFGEPESREFQRLFKELLNIQPYDSNNVISKIIASTKDNINNVENNDASDFIKQMVQCLFENFKSLKNRHTVFSETCPLINKNNQIKDSHSLFLNSNFNSGAITEELYSGILCSENYIIDLSYYDINEQDLGLIESFFIWLGVNKYVQFNEKKIFKEYWDPDPYINYVFTKIQKPELLSRYFFTGLEIGLFNETVSKLSNEKLIFLVLKEEQIRHALDFSNSDKFSYQYGNSYPDLHEKPSYISYQFSVLDRFNKYLIESNDIPFINEFQINYEDPIFSNNNIKENQINDILIKLGAKDSIKNLSTEIVYELIHECGIIRPEHKHTRKLYLQAFDHFKSIKNETSLFVIPDTKLLATKNGEKEYYPVADVYYSDNSTLPEIITRDLHIFDFPKRAGEIQISRFFGVRTFKDIKLNIIENSITDHPDGANFNDWFIRIKPLILTYRISSLKKADDKREAAHALKNCSIRLVSDVLYTIDDKNQQRLGYEEFQVVDNLFILCDQSFKRLDHFRNSSKFCGSFAEILCILFKVNESKNNYISVFKDSIEFSKELIKADSLDEYLMEAYTLLGISQNESLFWETICNIKKIRWSDLLRDELQLKYFIKDNLKLELPSYYKNVDFENFCNKESAQFLEFVFDKLGISMVDIKNCLPSFTGLQKWHLNKIIDISYDIENMFANTLWDYLSTLSINEQMYFLNKRNAFRDWFTAKQWYEIDLQPFKLEVDYKNLLLKVVQEEFKIELVSSIDPIRIQSEYIELLEKNDEIEKSFNEEQKSLLYFVGHKNEVQSIIESLTIQTISSPNTGDLGNTTLPILISQLKINVPLIFDNHKKQKSGKNIVDPNKERNKRKTGRLAEMKVRDTLVALYGRKNVQWVSGNSDEDKTSDLLGFDIRYRENENEDWCFLEVKSVSGNSFFISTNELNVAFSNKTKYHLALVNIDQIIIDRNFFNNIELENEYIRLNSNLFIKPIDFMVFIEP